MIPCGLFPLLLLYLECVAESDDKVVVNVLEQFDLLADVVHGPLPEAGLLVHVLHGQEALGSLVLNQADLQRGNESG